MKTKFIIFFLVLYAGTVNGQKPEWVIYNTSNSGLSDNSIRAISIDNFNNKWIGTVYGGVAKFDNTNWTNYNTSNSGLNIGNIQAVYVDANDNKWFGSGWNGKISKFDNENWVIYDATNTNSVISNDGSTAKFLFANDKLFVGTNAFGLKTFDGNNWESLTSELAIIMDLKKDHQGNIWIAYGDKGLTKYDGTTWINYTSANSILPSNSITSIAVDANDIIWATTKNEGLVKISGKDWTLYNTANSGIPSNNLKAIAIDKSNIKWMSSDYDDFGKIKGLIKFDDKNWTIYNTTNSDIQSNELTSIVVDEYNNKWIGTSYYGMAVFNEDGVVLSDNDITKFKSVISVYPNPFNSELVIRLFNEEQTTITLYNILGQETLHQSFKNTVRIKTAHLAKGMYLYELSDSKGKIKIGKLIKL